MTARRTQVPSYRLHKARGTAVVTLEGKNHYLGPFGSPESKARYNRLVADYLRGELDPARVDERSYLVGQLCEDFLDWASNEYRAADGTVSPSVNNLRLALRKLVEFFADIPAAEFGPSLLVSYREQLITAGLARSTINDRVKLVRRAFKWATQCERIPPSVLQGLQAVSGLRRGRAGARETKPVRPVPDGDIDAALRFMSAPVQAMVQVQLLCGARPGEVISMRKLEIEQAGSVWIYRPEAHKSAWRGKDRVIFLGPRCQETLEPFLDGRSEDSYLFSPSEAELARRKRLRENRKTPLFPSHLRALESRRKSAPERRPRDHYDRHSYRQAISRACKRAGVEPWTPNRLRHNAATRLRAEFGLDVAKCVLGHSRVETTQIYAEADLARAMQAMRETG